MWARVCEMVLSIWLIVCHFLFTTNHLVDISCAVLIGLFALLSYIEKINKIHLLQVIPAGWLLWISYSYPTPWLPFFMQNYIITALFLLMFCIIPTNATKPPRAWENFK